jgi:hypothetical protein
LTKEKHSTDEGNTVLTKVNTILTKVNTVLMKVSTVLTKVSTVLTKENTVLTKENTIGTDRGKKPPVGNKFQVETRQQILHPLAASCVQSRQFYCKHAARTMI